LASLASAATWSACVTSHTTPNKRGPPSAAAAAAAAARVPPLPLAATTPKPASSWRSSASAASSARWLRPVTTTESRCVRNSRASALPRPRVLPVTTTLSGDAGGRHRRARQ
jgi:hypothetical protein